MHRPIRFARGLLVGLLALGPLASAAQPHLVPRPLAMEVGEGTFTLSDPVRIVASPEARVQEVAGLLADRIRERMGFRVLVASPEEVFFNDHWGRSGTSEIWLRSDLEWYNPEAYALSVTPSRVTIMDASGEGVWWGVQTLWQLLPPEVDDARGPRPEAWTIPVVDIVDEPRFGWRGSLMDVSRHFFPVEEVERYIDLLARYKMNVLHWHLTEDQGWRLAIEAYPRLTEVGAWRTEPDGSRYGGFYTQDEVRHIVEYARQRGVRVVPEIEMPGHASAALVAYPELACADPPEAVPNAWGVFRDIYCVGKPEVFAFLDTVLTEVAGLFPDPYVHIGGDEVPKERWRDCASCQALKEREGLPDDEALQGYFLRRVNETLVRHGKTMVGWDEILEGGAPEGAVVQVWRDMESVREAVESGHPVVASPTSHAYFDYSPAALPLAQVYSFDPVPDGLSPEAEALVLGGEGNLWSEYITPANFDLMAFPRVLALAEVLWSPEASGDSARAFADFERRLDEGELPRLRARGVTPGPKDSDVLRLSVGTDASGAPRVRVESAVEGIVVRASRDGSAPAPDAPAVSSMTTFSPGDRVVIRPFLNGEALPMTRSFTVEDHLARTGPVTLMPPPDVRYPGPSAGALTDGLLGSAGHRDGLSQGWWDHDLDATVDLGSVQPVRSVTLHTLQNVRSWILPPEAVTVYVSADGETWHTHQARHTMASGDESVRRVVIEVPVDGQARYVRVTAPRRALPDDHPGAGHAGWLFADEIVVR